MSVRLSVVLLACLVVLSVAAALAGEWHSRNKAIQGAERELATLVEVRTLSRLAHLLQQERGLTAGHLAGYDEEIHTLFVKQRAATDVMLAGLKGRQGAGQGLFGRLATELPGLRHRVDNGEAGWPAVRSFYSGWILVLLDEAVRRLSGEQPADLAVTIGMINNLALCREKLGLIRALLNRLYVRQAVDAAEVLDVAANYGAFQENLHAFRRDAPPAVQDAFQRDVEGETFSRVMAQVQAVLRPGGQSVSAGNAPVLWWRQATLVIDSMKQVEGMLFATTNQRLRDKIVTKRSGMTRFAMVALAVSALAVLLTIYTVIRILRALEVLLKKLEQVMQHEDFGVRLPSLNGDEFGRINLSINSLLGYTEDILKEKDVIANTDLLTGLPNRRTILEAAEREIRRDKRYGKGVALVFCDIDHFKQVNDRHAHDVGDEVLRRFSAMLRGAIRETDLAGRWGGEEFIVLVPSGNVDEAGQLAEKLRRLTEALSVPPVERLTCSFGVAVRAADEEFDDLCRRADQALYEAKNSGRNRVCFAPSARQISA